MQALSFDGTFKVRNDVAVPRPRRNEALIRVRTAGVCNTDLEIRGGYKGYHGILGHEFVGEVAECSQRVWIGRRVCGEITVGCGSCAQCAAGLSMHCFHREVMGMIGRDGAFAEYLALPVANLHLVPDTITDDTAVFVEPVAAAYEVLQQVSLHAGTRVVVLGDGKLGLLCAQVAAQTGAEVLLLGRHEQKLRLARLLGLQATSSSAALPTRVQVVIEATGSPDGLRRALELVEPRGTVVLKSTTARHADLDLSTIVVNEITVLGSRCGPFPEAMRGLEAGAVQVLPLITDRYPLAEADLAIVRAGQPGVLKVLIDVGTGRGER